MSKSCNRDECRLEIQKTNEPQNILLNSIQKDVSFIVDQNNKEHERILRKIDQSISAANELRKQSENKWNELYQKVMTQELRDAGFYGKTVIVSGIVGMAATYFVVKFFAIIWEFLTKKM